MKTKNMIYLFAAFFFLLDTPAVFSQNLPGNGEGGVVQGQTRLERIRAKQKRLQAELQAEHQKEAEKEAELKAGNIITDSERTFSDATMTVQRQLEESLVDLSRLREKIAEEKIPLSRKLSDLESELVKIRLEYQQATRLLDSRTLDLSNLRNEIKSREEEATYLSNLLGEYIRNFESRLHIAEIQRYRKPLEEAKLALENTGLTKKDVYQAQADLVAESIHRLDDALGGTRFEGSAVVESGLVQPGYFVLVGPSAIFRSNDGKNTGTAEQRLGSLEPAVISYQTEADAEAATKLVEDSKGFFPVDPTQGSAHKIEETKETLVEHIRKGGPVMVPILGMAAAALLVALLKWMTMWAIRRPSESQISELLSAVARRDKDEAMFTAQKIKGPVGKMLISGVEHLNEPRELVEEVMFETVLSTRLRLQSFLPFISICAASAPLLGLLGTVTGIINTFKLITVFGSGDVKTLSSGISEALITTEYGLIVAIPSLLLHAFLSRKARGVVDQMEKAAIAFINQVSKANARTTGSNSARENEWMNEAIKKE